jgi:hypothetical protein
LLVRGSGIPLEKGIGILRNREKRNGIVIHIPLFGNNICILREAKPKLPKAPPFLFFFFLNKNKNKTKIKIKIKKKKT